MWRAFTVCAVGVMWVAQGCATMQEGSVVPQDSYPTLEAYPVDVDVEAQQRTTAPRRERSAPGDFVPADVDLGDPRDVKTMTVRVHIKDDYRLPSAPNHVVEAQPFDMKTVRIEAKPGGEVTEDERLEAMEINERIDADDETLRDLARSIVEDAYDDRERVDLLVRWVYGHVTYTISSEEVASAVLASATGDCSEYSLLFVAMARASGIPARRVVGLAYTYNYDEPAFGYHAWAEVEIDGHWVQVDPTWNETVADATHIKLTEGDSDYWAKAAGNIQLWILDFDRSADAGAVDPGRVAAELPAYLRLRD